MPGTRCAVGACNNSIVKTKHLSKIVTYFSFPRDENLSNIWVEKCQREKPINPRSSTVCSEHFKEEDFLRNLRAELLGMRVKKLLKRGAIPSLKLEIDPLSLAAKRRRDPGKKLVSE